MADSILNVDNVKGARVTLTVDDGTNSPQVTASSDHAQVARIELDKVHNLVAGDVQLNGIVNLDQRIGVADGTAIMCGQEGDALRSSLNSANLAQLVL